MSTRTAVEVDREHARAADRRVHRELPLAEGGASDRGEIAAAAVIVTIPLAILVLILQRRIVSGLTAGAVKG
jgi:ABC-type glycerol-3-phosphate transport system permease component